MIPNPSFNCVKTRSLSAFLNLEFVLSSLRFHHRAHHRPCHFLANLHAYNTRIDLFTAPGPQHKMHVPQHCSDRAVFWRTLPSKCIMRFWSSHPSPPPPYLPVNTVYLRRLFPTNPRHTLLRILTRTCVPHCNATRRAKQYVWSLWQRQQRMP